MDPIKSLFKYYPVIRKYIAANSGTRAEAEDVFQEGILVYLEKAEQPGFVRTSSPETFLFGICKNLWQNELRKKGRFVSVPAELLPEAEPESSRVEEEKIRWAQQAIEFLEEKCRNILILYYHRKTSLADIALRLKMVSEGAVRNQKFQCLEKARKRFHELNNQNL
jgi:RNA polymerase sigma factor (sigma-70 family)